MNKFFREYVDLTALVIIFLMPLLLTVVIKRKTKKQTRAAAVYGLLFGPAGILTLMFFHLFENAYHAVDNAIAGTFVYNYHFYSMMLMGILLASVATFLIKACWQKCIGRTGSNRRIFLLMLLVAIVCLPLLPITSLSVVPVFCCLISLTGVYFVRRKVKLLEGVVFPNQTAD